MPLDASRKPYKRFCGVGAYKMTYDNEREDFMDDDLNELRQRIFPHLPLHATHYEGCHLHHLGCAVVWLIEQAQEARDWARRLLRERNEEEAWHIHYSNFLGEAEAVHEDIKTDLDAAIAERDAANQKLSDTLKRLEDAQGEIQHLRDTRQDPYDQIELFRSQRDMLGRKLDEAAQRELEMSEEIGELKRRLLTEPPK